jgi:hypothetical protein
VLWSSFDRSSAMGAALPPPYFGVSGTLAAVLLRQVTAGRRLVICALIETAVPPHMGIGANRRRT